jgi:alpha-galactosidase
VTSDGTLFARGADGQVWQRTSTGRWSGLGAPGGKPIYGRPGAATSTSGTVVAVRTADDSVWVRTKTGESWSDWTGIGGTVSSSPTLVAVGPRVVLTASASDYSLWANDWSGSWAGWFKRPEYPSGSIVGTLGAASDGASLWFAARGPDDHVHVAKF